MSLVDRVLAGERLALAQLLTRIENEEKSSDEALSALFPYAGKAHRVGITGAPGTGKSTLVNQLALHLRRVGVAGAIQAVAVVAVDPSSPFSGGAILGDRIRMRDLAGDQGVFIRSMASRGALGGLARTTSAMVDVLDAAGFETILIETVGAGQAEVEVASAAHTTVVLEAPGLGDSVQAIKAGLLEIADVLVVNKADLPGAETTLQALRSSIELGYLSGRRGGRSPTEVEDRETWIPPVLKTVAVDGDGIADLAETIYRHREHLVATGEWRSRERARVRSEMQTLLRDLLAERFLAHRGDGTFERAVEEVLARRLSPRQAVEAMIEKGGAP